MQSLQTKKKIAISLGVIVAIVAVSSAMTLFMVLSGDKDSGLAPTNGMPAPGSNVPEMIVSGDTPVTNGMPVPGNSVREMIVSNELK